MLWVFRQREGIPSALEKEEQRARIQKLVAETKLTTFQLSGAHQRYERVKAAAAIGGLVTAIAAFIGLFLSAAQWLRAEDAARRLRTEERLDRSLALLGGENAATRLGAAVSLSSFLTRDTEYASAALQALTNALAIEESITVRNAIVAAIQRIKPEQVTKAELDRALESLVVVSRGLVDEGSLWSSRRTSVFFTPNHNSVESRALSVGTAIASLLHNGARSADMSRVYLSSVDLSGLDLAGIRWDDSILAWTDFSRSDLTGASFRDADLENTTFVSARLSRADFSVSADSLATKRRSDYVREQLRRDQLNAQLAHAPATFTIHGPDFSCADLAGANFDRHPLIAIYADEFADVIDYYVSFREANVAGASFMNLGGFGIELRGQGYYMQQPFPTTRSGAGWASGDQYAIAEFKLASDRSLQEGWETYSDSLQALRIAFDASNWRAARLDRPVHEALSKLNVYSWKTVPPCHEPR